MKSVYILIGGRVQGVGFRYFAQLKANELNIVGWVRNTPDGKVEIEASGESVNLDSFVDWMKIGPSRSSIRTFSVTEFSTPRTFTNFTIR